MSKEKRSGCCLWRLIKFVLMLLLLGSVAYSVYYFSLTSNEEEYVDYYKEPIEENDTIAYVIPSPKKEVDDYRKEHIDSINMYVHDSHYDYSEVAKSITATCEDDYQKIRAIYKWICDNIAYDTSYSIYSADNCYDAKKGVCQAYCELFYQIAKAANVKAEIVVGKSKDQNGQLGTSGHAWVFAYTRGNHGILLDPTWGAGYVDGDKFIRSDYCWDWFNVPPELMILSHFPEDDSYQLIDNPITMEEFVSLIPASISWLNYGLDTHMLFMKARKHELEMPKFYDSGERDLIIINIPLCNSLKVGNTYTFRIKMKAEKDFAIINRQKFIKKEEWNDEGDGVFSINYEVKDPNTLKLSVKGEFDDYWYSLIEYRIE